MKFVHWNGKIVSEHEASIPISDRGFLYGDGLFTTIKVTDGKPECFPLHLQRLATQCQQLRILTPEITFGHISELIDSNGAHEGTWRLKIIITGGDGDQLHLSERAYGQLLLTLKPYTGPFCTPCRLSIFPWPISKPTAELKSLAYLDRLWIKDYALQRGFDDAIVLDFKHHLLETAFCNIMWKHDDQMFTPSDTLPLVPGVSLQIIKTVIHQMGLRFQSVQAKLNDIPKEANLFVCNSLMGPCPVVEVDDQRFSCDTDFEKNLVALYRIASMHYLHH